MVTTIGNPISWGARAFGRAGHEMRVAAEGMGSHAALTPVVRRIGIDDIRGALRDGIADFAALRSDVAVMCLLYPLMGAVLVWLAMNQSLAFLAFPLISGFALVGPAVAVGLYEMSRRRSETGQAGWADAFGVFASPSFGAIVVLGLMLVGVFTIWMLTAWAIYLLTLGPEPPLSFMSLLRDATGTTAGWTMTIAGFAAGFVFAAIVLAVSLVSFPMLIDRPVGLPVAVVTSVRVARENPVTVALWGLIVAVLLALGALPMLIGLAIVLPVLGHATWHLYRRAVTFA